MLPQKSVPEPQDTTAAPIVGIWTTKHIDISTVGASYVKLFILYQTKHLYCYQIKINSTVVRQQ